jgi:adenosylcobinamide-GDP ribazoletransferase
MTPWHPFLIALQFLTLVPVHFKQPPEATQNGRSLLYYPLVGLLMGGVLWGVLALAGGLAPGMAAALTLGTWVLISGGLHLDGLADSADAWMGGFGDRERTLEIMHDPYCGPMGVITLILILLLKFTALEALIEQQQTLLLIAIPVLGRGAVLALFLTTPYIRRGGIGEQMARHLPRTQGIGVLLLTMILLTLWLGSSGLWLLMGSAITLSGIRWLLLKRLQGTTGDTAGALLEITECVAVLLAATL